MILHKLNFRKGNITEIKTFHNDKGVNSSREHSNTDCACTSYQGFKSHEPKLIEQKRKKEKCTNKIKNFNTPLSVIERTGR